MIEKRNRNGGRDANQEEEQDEDEAAPAPQEPASRKREAAPSRTAPPATEAPPRARGAARVIFLLLAIAAAALLYRFWGFWQTEPQTEAAPPPPTVTVAKPLVKEMEEWNDFTGQFEPMESVEVRARVSGYLESVNFTDGQLVKKGDLLFVIEPRPFELALETSKAQLAQAEAQLQLAQAQLDRTAQLRKNDYATKETYDERVSQVAIATASREATA
jgi:multidrug efflux pump subunit AcrA (membrane-fusion protein)